jgi:hypothetical protein
MIIKCTHLLSTKILPSENFWRKRKASKHRSKEPQKGTAKKSATTSSTLTPKKAKGRSSGTSKKNNN